MDGIDQETPVRDTEPVQRVVSVRLAHASNAGWIRNLLTEPCGGVSLIACRLGSQRSSHYHKTDSHWLYVADGVMKYWERPVGSTAKPTEYRVGKGQMIHTGPMVEHWTEFPEETLLISMSDRPRDHVSHEEDVVRVGPRPSDWAVGVDLAAPELLVEKKPPRMRTAGRSYRGRIFHIGYDENTLGDKQRALDELSDAKLDAVIAAEEDEQPSEREGETP
jgi:quercetin dioxygenase-like cupin family protein